MRKLVQTNVPGLVKDEKEGTIINKNVGLYDVLIAQRKKNKEAKKLLQDIENIKANLKLINEALGIKL